VEDDTVTMYALAGMALVASLFAGVASFCPLMAEKTVQLLEDAVPQETNSAQYADKGTYVRISNSLKEHLEEDGEESSSSSSGIIGIIGIS
jgi:hypothetical protein